MGILVLLLITQFKEGLTIVQSRIYLFQGKCPELPVINTYEKIKFLLIKPTF